MNPERFRDSARANRPGKQEVSQWVVGTQCSHFYTGAPSSASRGFQFLTESSPCWSLAEGGVKPST